MLHRTGLSELVEEIRAAHRQRIFAMKQRQRLDLALLAFIRLALGWRRDLPDDERKKIALAAVHLVLDGGGAYSDIVMASKLATEPFKTIEKTALKRLETLSLQIPAWKRFGDLIRGFGLASLATIVAEVGDLSLYSSHSKLWKRMGLAVIDGAAQGKPGAKASKEVWIEHGYSPARRSRMWNIGDALIKGNRDGKYRTLYLKRKEHELTRGLTKLHAHRRAQRYMEKALLRDLWRAWNSSG